MLLCLINCRFIITIIITIIIIFIIIIIIPPTWRRGFLSGQWRYCTSRILNFIVLQRLDENDDAQKWHSSVESILKKGDDLAVFSDAPSLTSSKDRTRKQAQQTNAISAQTRRSNRRRVLFKNNVSVYRYDSDPSQNDDDDDSRHSRRLETANGARSIRAPHDADVKPPTSRNGCRVNSSPYSVDDNISLKSSYTVAVGDFEVRQYLSIILLYIRGGPK